MLRKSIIYKDGAYYNHAPLTTIKMNNDNNNAANAGRTCLTNTFDALVGSFDIITPLT